MTKLLGIAMGTVLSPITFLGSYFRHARALHPFGVTYRADVLPSSYIISVKERKVAERLSGSALVRLSNALHKYDRHAHDILGCTIRFGWEASNGVHLLLPQHQDLLLATARSPFTLPFAYFSTQQEDFFSNRFYAIAPFQIDGLGVRKFRVGPVFTRGERKGQGKGSDRYERLLDRVERGLAMFRLEVKGPTGIWKPLLKIELKEKVELDQEQLKFSPYHSGRGIYPVGFVNGMRKPAYKASQAGRDFSHHNERIEIPERHQPIISTYQN